MNHIFFSVAKWYSISLDWCISISKYMENNVVAFEAAGTIDDILND